MKIIKKTATELVMQNPASRAGKIFGVTWIIASLGIPAFLYWWSAANVVNVACDRIEPTIVNCEASYSKGIPFLASSPITVTGVHQAVVENETRQGDERTYQVYRLSLLANNGQSFAITDFHRAKGWHESFARDINSQLQSATPSWEISATYAYAPFAVTSFAIASILSAMLGFLFVFVAAEERTLSINKRLDQVTDDLHKLWHLGGYTKHYQLSDLDIKFNEYEDEYRTRRCNLTINLGDSDIPIYQGAANAKKLYGMLCKFLERSSNP